jgi:molecular chaperone GrpE
VRTFGSTEQALGKPAKSPVFLSNSGKLFQELKFWNSLNCKQEESMSKHHHDRDHETGPQRAEGDPAVQTPQEKETAPEANPQAVPGGAGDSGEGPGSETPKNREKELEEKAAALEARLEEAKDQYLRKAADFENFRKRMNREKQEAIDYANQSLLGDLIQTIDDFDRAIKAAESMARSSPEFTSFYEGVSMIEKRLSSQLENKWGLKRFDSEGEPFDPNRHEAMMMEKSPDIHEPVVKEEYYKGYTLRDRVIRSAKVKVLMPEQPSPAENGETPDNGK